MSDDRKKIFPEASGNFGAGEGSRPGKVEEGDDLRHHTKATLKDYLKWHTHRNSFPVQHESEKDPETGELKSLHDEASIATPVGPEPKVSTQVYDSQEKQESFLDVTGDSLGAREFNKLSDSGKFTQLDEPSSTLRSFFDKTQRGPGHDLLRDIIPSTHVPGGEGEELKIAPSDNTALFHTVPESAPEQQKRISSVLVQNNRFTPTGDSPYLKDGKYSQFQGSLGSVHTSLGVHSLNTPAGNLAISEMRKVGLELIARQAGHNVDGDAGSFDVLAGPGFFSNRISKSNMLARNTKIGQDTLGQRAELDHSVTEYEEVESATVTRFENTFAGRRGKEESDNFFSIADKSFGNGFSHLERFTNNSMAHTVFILQGLMGTLLSGAIMGIFLELLYAEFEDSRAQGSDPASLTMGKWTDAPEATLVTYGIPYLKYPVFNSIASGMLALFGLRKKSNLPEEKLGMWLAGFLMLIVWFAAVLLSSLTAIPDFIAAMGRQKGLFVTLIRNAMRDNDKLNRIFSDPGGFIADLLMQIAMSAITGRSKASILLGVVEMFTQVSGFKFFMTLAVIGDKCYEGEISDFSGIHIKLDQLEDNGQTRIYKSRVNRVSNALAWRHRSAPSLMYLPGETFGAMEMLGGTPSAAIAAVVKAGDNEGTEIFRRKVHFDTQNNSHRFHPDDVLYMENQLEAEYMPFYFQDLRTNEIISFHAFITDMKDSYSSEYSDSSGFGRMDPVKIYKRTTRSINVSFYVTSTSEEDFDSMWLSVNKLTQLIYPQWSAGRPVSDGKEGFIMPNSQFMTSSPMIRMRIGDYVRSNSSRFNLAKLFGIQHEDDALGEATGGAAITRKGGAEPKDFAKAATTPMQGNVEAGNQLLSNDTTSDIKAAIGQFAILKRSTTHGYVAKADKKGFALFGIGSVDPPLFKVWTRCDAVVEILKTEKRPGAAKDSEKELDEGFLNKRVYQVEVKFKDDTDKANPFAEASDDKKPFKMYVLPSDLKPIHGLDSVKSGTAASDDLIDLPSLALDGGLQEFLSADPEKGNPVFQAAYSMRGRGLAGFITSMDFDYSEATYETASLTRRAPKMIKVSLNFAPIHDIAPGMDHMGGMRAPIYPVGDIMAQLSQDDIRNLKEYGYDTVLHSADMSYGAPFAPKVTIGAPAISASSTASFSPQEIFESSAAKVSKKRLT